MNAQPCVTVVTPVYNGANYLTECIESVLHQTYTNWRYVIVNNCSSDSTLDIARHYESSDNRISVITNSSFVGPIENHNIAVKQITPESKYCKVVSADDWLFPECLEKLVQHAESYPSVGIVNSYQLTNHGQQWQVKWAEVPYPSPVIPGYLICRDHLLGSPYVFGTPTSCLYRGDLIRERSPFYPHSLPHADWSLCYECLQTSDFGFVHKVLSFSRNHPASVSSACRRMRTLESAILRNLIAYGPVYLTRDEYKSRLDAALDDYYHVLAVGLFNGEKSEFWRFHRKDLRELGYRCFGWRFYSAALGKLLDMVLNPKQTLEKVFRRTDPLISGLQIFSTSEKDAAVGEIKAQALSRLGGPAGHAALPPSLESPEMNTRT